MPHRYSRPVKRSPGRYMGKRSRYHVPPLVTLTVVTAYVRGLVPIVTVHLPAAPQLEVPPERAHLFLDTGPRVDVRCVGTSGYLSGRLHEDAWVITVVAFDAHVAYDTLDEAIDALRDDVHANRVEVGTHRSTPWAPELESPVEAVLRRFHEAVLRDPENRRE